MPETFTEKFHKAQQWEPSLEGLQGEVATAFLLAGFFHSLGDSLRPLSKDDKPYIHKAAELLLKLGRLLRKESDNGQPGSEVDR